MQAQKEEQPDAGGCTHASERMVRRRLVWVHYCIPIGCEAWFSPLILDLFKLVLLSLGSKKGVLCPTGCELKNTILKQERNVRPTVTQLKTDVDDLNRNTNSIYKYVNGLSDELRERQKVTDGKSQACLSPAKHHTFPLSHLTETFVQRDEQLSNNNFAHLIVKM